MTRLWPFVISQNRRWCRQIRQNCQNKIVVNWLDSLTNCSNSVGMGALSRVCMRLKAINKLIFTRTLPEELYNHVQFMMPSLSFDLPGSSRLSHLFFVFFHVFSCLRFSVNEVTKEIIVTASDESFCVRVLSPAVLMEIIKISCRNCQNLNENFTYVASLNVWICTHYSLCCFHSNSWFVAVV